MTRTVLLAALALLAALPVQAQYKVVGPDGKVTYTDRPPTEQSGTVAPVRGAAAAPVANATPLPAELRPVVQRFPVVLYSAPDCAPCDSARSLLRQRGIPLTERQVLTNDDLPALERATGSRSLPTMTVGAQAAAGYSEAQWSSLLDLAGYPRESRLPRDYAGAPATPLVARQAVAPAGQARTQAPQAPAEPPPPPASGIRF
ncbi:glutaredoxin family protein [Aquabacterium sp.]|uniref:glutaredoxin family protein n=1 Tax=Aquabacterium sp. TaxID=1872578 RepID=UPI002C7CADE8|nr:glutaredoxin family protein [Aquabacterium sp.]HSW03733.1 glutaredoxin family protein [Aquabacterium sp.]